MRKVGWISLVLVTTVAGYVVGASVGKRGKPEGAFGEPLPEGERRDTTADQVRILRARLARVRNAVAEEEQRIGDLTAKMEEAGAKLPPPLDPEEEKRRRDERGQARYEETKGLRRKILQRKDKALREEGLAELTALLESDDPEQVLLGLATLPWLQGINLDMETFLPHVFAALDHDDAEVRGGAIRSLSSVCSKEEQLEVMLSMSEDPASEVRGHAFSWLRWLGQTEEDERIPSALRAAFQDEDPYVRRRAVGSLSDDDLREMEDLVIELTKDPETNRLHRSLMLRRNPGAKLVERMVEMLEMNDPSFPLVIVMHQSLTHWMSDETKPILADFCLRVVRDGLDRWDRRSALDTLSRMGDASVVPQLEEIARGPDAEGIEDHLARTIENLRKRASEER